MMEQDLAHQVYVHGRFLFKVAYHILRNAAAAEDACQQAFLKAWQHQDKLRSREALRAWLTQTVIRECLNVCRQRRKEGRVLERRWRTAAAWEIDEPARGEQREKVLASVAELSEPVRTVVVLRLLEGMPGNEVKDILQCSAVTVSRLLHEGMEILRRKLRDLQETAGEI